MNTLVLVRGNLFDGISDSLTGPAEILVKDNMIADIGHSVERPPHQQATSLASFAGGACLAAVRKNSREDSNAWRRARTSRLEVTQPATSAELPVRGSRLV